MFKLNVEYRVRLLEDNKIQRFRRTIEASSSEEKVVRDVFEKELKNEFIEKYGTYSEITSINIKILEVPPVEVTAGGRGSMLFIVKPRDSKSFEIIKTDTTKTRREVEHILRDSGYSVLFARTENYLLSEYAKKRARGEYDLFGKTTYTKGVMKYIYEEVFPKIDTNTLDEIMTIKEF